MSSFHIFTENIFSWKASKTYDNFPTLKSNHEQHKANLDFLKLFLTAYFQHKCIVDNFISLSGTSQFSLKNGYNTILINSFGIIYNINLQLLHHPFVQCRHYCSNPYPPPYSLIKCVCYLSFICSYGPIVYLPWLVFPTFLFSSFYLSLLYSLPPTYLFPFQRSTFVTFCHSFLLFIL